MGTYDSVNGFQSNTNYLTDRMIADQAAAEEAAKKQEEGNQHQGAAAIAGAGIREERDFLDDAMDWTGDKVDGAIDSVVGAASSAWNGVKGAASAVWNGAMSGMAAVGNAASNAWNATKNAVFGPDKVVMMPAMGGSMQPLYHENVGDGAAYGASSSRGASVSDRHLRAGENAISNYLDKQRSENPYLRKGISNGIKYNEVDVSMDPKYHEKLINMELEAGVSGGNLILNKASGKLYYRTEALGADHKLIPTNPNERVSAPWTYYELHTDNDNGIMSGDYHAPKGSAQSVWGPNGGKYMIIGVKTLGLGGNEITTQTKINGKTITEKHRHVLNEMPDVAYQAFKNKTPLPYGTPFGYTGITGNMAVSIETDKNSPRFGMLSALTYHAHNKVENAETHSGFIKGVTFGPEVRQSQGLPAFDYTSYYKKKALDSLTGGK
ncbi:hypothetical protein HGB47_16905 [Leptospira yasudae]|nr:hypothetical protein [Leptospira yasudae]